MSHSCLSRHASNLQLLNARLLTLVNGLGLKVVFFLLAFVDLKSWFVRSSDNSDVAPRPYLFPLTGLEDRFP